MSGGGWKRVAHDGRTVYWRRFVPGGWLVAVPVDRGAATSGWRWKQLERSTTGGRPVVVAEGQADDLVNARRAANRACAERLAGA